MLIGIASGSGVGVFPQLRLLQRFTFTSVGAVSATMPARSEFALIVAVGGGGTGSAFGGGGGGGRAQKVRCVSPGEVISGTVGAATQATTVDGMTANGGQNSTSTVGLGGAAIGGDVNFSGSNGFPGAGGNAGGYGEAAGGWPSGPGGASPPAPGGLYGGGGAADGGAGVQGIIIIDVYGYA